MNVCEEYREMIFEKVEGTLTKERVSFLEKHLENCKICREALLQMEEIKKGLENFRLSVNSDFNERLKSRINKEKKKTLSIYYKVFSYAAGVAVIAISFIALNNQNQAIEFPSKNLAVKKILVDSATTKSNVALIDENKENTIQSDSLVEPKKIEPVKVKTYSVTKEVEIK